MEGSGTIQRTVSLQRYPFNVFDHLNWWLSETGAHQTTLQITVQQPLNRHTMSHQQHPTLGKYELQRSIKDFTYCYNYNFN